MSIPDAEQILRRTEIFEYRSMPPKRQVQAWNLLLDQPDATTRFESIAAQGQTAGRLYALCALLALHSQQASQLASELVGRTDTLLAVESDLASHKPVAALVEIIRTRRLWDELRRMKEETRRRFEKAG